MTPPTNRRRIDRDATPAATGRTTRREVLASAAAMAAGSLLPSAGPFAATGVYDRALVVDALCFSRDWGDADLDALRQARYAGIVESLPNADLQTAIDALVGWRERVAARPDRLLLALSATDIERAAESGRTAVLMNFQNATMLEGKLNNIDALHALGMRSFQLTYNFRNRLGDGCLERTDAGLSDFGLEVVERMNRLGVMIDLSHCGRQTTLDGIAFSEQPVAITHTMCDALRPGHPRAKTDAQMRACADKGGVIGMIALGYFIGPDPGGETTIEDYADHVEHAVSVVGHEHVGLASDFPPQGISPWATRENWYEPRVEAFKPNYELRWPPWIPEVDTPDRFRNLVAVLERRGWTESNLERLLGANWLRLFRATLG
ncbi:MAG: dipeptidase [Gammaproteobacteria bacterium]|nr:dipeptidase [Gammaproteobacteria bacterium]MDH4255474.1 dipeptidase [Gammaproteobacteria bacterium]MDH5309511.1 dipeptidase [Gammaproteobacteria bacterium]